VGAPDEPHSPTSGLHPDVVNEERLLGGTSPRVVRVGDTVRRPAGPWTAIVGGVLRYLEQFDFPAPRTLGTDDQGRQVLTWLPGATTYEQHAAYWSDLDHLGRAARLVRRLHDLLDGFEPPADAVWRGGWGRSPHGGGPICHWDLAPWNVVTSPEGALGIIDWDGAGPGDRMFELAYAIHGFVPLRRDAECRRLGWVNPPPRVGRLEEFWQSYGLPSSERSTLADALIDCARDGAAFGEQMHAEGREPWASRWAADEGAGDGEDLAVAEAVAREWIKHRGA